MKCGCHIAKFYEMHSQDISLGFSYTEGYPHHAKTVMWVKFIYAFKWSMAFSAPIFMKLTSAKLEIFCI
jgi:hypothetical protein